MKYLYKVISLIFLAASFSACSEESLMDINASNQLELIATMGNSATRASMSIIDGTLDVISRWDGTDNLDVFCSPLGNEYSADVNNVSIAQVIDDGKSAKFRFEPLKSWNVNTGKFADDCKFAYITPRCYPKYDSEQKKLFINASLLRNPLESFMAPVYGTGEVLDEFKLTPTTFKHYYAYELLHISNTTNHDINFSLNGFEGLKWFMERGSICIDDEKFYQESVATRGPVEYTDMTIPAGGERILMSAYIPTGQKMTDARLVATIDGELKKTTHTKSSDAEILIGQAYHMYAEWNGKELKFVDPNSDNSPQFVDLGLSVKWATNNVGANNPWEYGDYYAWGESSPKFDYRWATHKWYDRASESYKTPYSTTVTLKAADDAATTAWGTNWRTPTREELSELLNKCYWVWTNSYMGKKVNGYIVYKAKSYEDAGVIKYANNTTSRAGSSYNYETDAHIFLPAAGEISDAENPEKYYSSMKSSIHDTGFYWSSTKTTGNSSYCLHLGAEVDRYYMSCYYPFYFGFSIRPVFAQ